MAKENERRRGRAIVKAGVTLPGAVATETSLTLPKDVTQEQCANLLRVLLRSESRNSWFIGDTINQSEDRWKEYTRILLEEFDSGSLKNFARVCGAIPPACRRGPPLTYSHHVVVYDLPEKEREAWLSRAEDEGWSVRKFRDVVKPPESLQTSEARAEPPPRDHTKIQWLLLQLGRDMSHDVWVAPDDRLRSWAGNKLRDIPGLKNELPRQFAGNVDAHQRVRRIDVLWMKRGVVSAAFEIEATTSVFSGLLRMSDLVALVGGQLRVDLYIVAPAARRDKVIREINRPTFSELGLPNKCRLITFERLTQYSEQYSDIASYLDYSFLKEEISESLALTEGDTSTLEDD